MSFERSLRTGGLIARFHVYFSTGTSFQELKVELESKQGKLTTRPTLKFITAPIFITRLIGT